MEAIVGAACILPGGVEGLDAFWSALLEARTFCGPVPPDRWNVERFHAPDGERPGLACMRSGHFLRRDLTDFDPAPFGISAAEAEVMDPQQRLLLEAAWDALHDAGYPPDNLPTRRVGVYVGGFTLDHLISQLGPEGRSCAGAHTAAGATLTMLSSRISHTLDLKGPCLTVDTACSSSLVAMHYALLDLRAGRCDLALVGGVNVMYRPEFPVAMSRGGFLAPDGRSKSFDARGDGYGRGEGAVVLVLRRLADALAAGDRILAECLASGINQDGRTPGISMPSAQAQRRLMAEVAEQAGVDPREVRYVEAHGTGTPAGDPIELSSIAAVYGAGRNGRPCLVGSVKANFGHMEAAAGALGVLKAALVLSRGVVPALAGLERPHPEVGRHPGIALAEKPVSLGAGRHVVAVNSFGYGGTNAHLVLRRAPAPARVAATPPRNGRRAFLVSAASPGALKGQASRLARRLRARCPSLAEVETALRARRALLPFRRVVWAESPQELVDALERLGSSGEPVPPPASAGHGRVAFVFTGMGPQWWGMGRGLLRRNPAFREELDRLDPLFRDLAGFSILEELGRSEPESRMGDPRIAQPATFALQAGICAFLADHGIRPHVVIGHSVGEVAAGYVSGLLDANDAVRVSVVRARLQARLVGRGAMLAAAVGREKARALVEALGGDGLCVAAFNGPRSVTFSGSEAAVAAVERKLAGEGIFHRRLRVSVPYHSAAMEEIAGELRSALAGLHPRTPTVPLFSTVTGGVLDAPMDAEYWVRNVRDPVRFQDAIESATRWGSSVFVEIGPHPALVRYIEEILEAHEPRPVVLGTLHREKDDAEALETVVGELLARTEAFDRTLERAGRLPDAPGYAWERRRLWREPPALERDRLGRPAAPLLERPVGVGKSFATRLGLASLAYLAEHRVGGTAVVPGACWLEAAMELLRAADGSSGSIHLRDVHFRRALAVGDGDCEGFIVRYDEETGRISVHVWQPGSASDDEGPLAVMIAGRGGSGAPPGLNGEPTGGVEHPVEEVYGRLEQAGLEYGETFRVIRRLVVDARGRSLRAELALRESASGAERDHVLHPALLDGAFQSVAALVAGGRTYVPSRIGHFWLAPKLALPPRALIAHVRLREMDADHLTADIGLEDPDGNVVAAMRDVRMEAVGRREAGEGAAAYAFVWETTAGDGTRARPGEPQDTAWALVGAGSDPVCERLFAALSGATGRAGRRVVLTEEGGQWKLSGAPLVLDGAKALGDALMDLQAELLVFVVPRDEEVPCQAAEAAAALALAWGRSRKGSRGTLCLVVDGGLWAGGEEAGPGRPGQAAVVGARRVLWAELAEPAVRLVDWDGSEPDLAASVILSREDRMDEVMVRGGQVRVPVLRRFDLERDRRLVTLAPGHAYEWERRDGSRVKALVPGGSGGAAGPGLEVMFTLCQASLGSGWAVAVGRLQGEGCGYRAWMGTAGRGSLWPASDAEGVLVELPGERPEDALQALLGAWGDLLAEEVDRRSSAVRRAVIQDEDPIGDALARSLKRRGWFVRRASDVGGIVDLLSREAWSGQQVGLVAVRLSAHGSWAAIREALSPDGTLVDLDAWRTGRSWPGAIPVSARWLASRRDRLAGLLRSVDGAQDPVPSPAALPLGAMARVTDEDLSRWTILDWRTPPEGGAALEPALPPMPREGWVLVTGGAGGLGSRLVPWLAGLGARRFVLVGRRLPDEVRSAPWWRELATRCELAYLRADVSVPAFADAVRRFRRERGEVAMAFHLAGLVEDRPAEGMGSESFRRPAAVKAGGLAFLLEGLDGAPLERLLVFSSFSAMVGNSRQLAYCAANLHAAALALREGARRPGLRVHVLHVGAVGEVGMVGRDPRVERHLRNIGLSPMSPDILLEALRACLVFDHREVAILLEPDWARWRASEPRAARSWRFVEVLSGAGVRGGRRMELCGALKAVPADRRGEALAVLMRDQVSAVLRTEAERIQLDSPLERLGIDSLIAAEVQAAFRSNLGIEVPVLALLAGSATLRRLATRCLPEVMEECA